MPPDQMRDLGKAASSEDARPKAQAKSRSALMDGLKREHSEPSDQDSKTQRPSLGSMPAETGEKDQKAAEEYKKQRKQEVDQTLQNSVDKPYENVPGRFEPDADEYRERREHGHPIPEVGYVPRRYLTKQEVAVMRLRGDPLGYYRTPTGALSYSPPFQEGRD